MEYNQSVFHRGNSSAPIEYSGEMVVYDTLGNKKAESKMENFSDTFEFSSWSASDNMNID